MDGSAGASGDSAADWLRAKCGATPPRDAHVFVIRDDDGAIEGMLMFSHWFTNADGTRADAEVTFEMDRPGTPAIIRAGMRYAFDELGLERITCHPRTDASRRMLELIGFTREGWRRGLERAIYGFTAADYRASRWAPRAGA